MIAEDVHRALREAWGPVFAQLGFRRATSGTASWRRPYTSGSDNGYMFVYAVVAWPGYSQEHGNFFYVNLGTGPDKSTRSIKGNTIRQAGEFFGPADDIRFRDSINAAIDEIPALRGSQCRTPSFLFYYRPEHVQQYAEMMAGLFPGIVDRYVAVNEITLSNNNHRRRAH